MAYQEVPFETEYMKGIDFILPIDPKVWKLEPNAKDAWARNWLKKNRKRNLGYCHIVGKNFNGHSMPANMAISSYKYKI